ncbi:unnamed protein product [Cuscuta campestris]|uniref:Uncharacterized protein n=1 Tax=Cuscuta campestris TaxID=132261 RepID=A0A484LMU5_9ASTE|nr:unnamed protein product [Cuscuta campestris]
MGQFTRHIGSGFALACPRWFGLGAINGKRESAASNARRRSRGEALVGASQVVAGGSSVCPGRVARSGNLPMLLPVAWPGGSPEVAVVTSALRCRKLVVAAGGCWIAAGSGRD